MEKEENGLFASILHKFMDERKTIGKLFPERN